MLELDKKYKRGRMTFIYCFSVYGWWLTLIAFGLMYLSWALKFGMLEAWAIDYLAQHPDWYVTSGLVAQWVLLTGISFLLVAYLRTWVMYGNYKFTLNEHGLHLSKGIFFVNEMTIPYQQISNVRIARPYSFRMMGLAKLDVTTNGDSGAPKDDKSADFLFPVIDVKIARALSQQLMTYATMAQHGEKLSKDVIEKVATGDVDDSGEGEEDEEFDAEDSDREFEVKKK